MSETICCCGDCLVEGETVNSAVFKTFASLVANGEKSPDLYHADYKDQLQSVVSDAIPGNRNGVVGLGPSRLSKSVSPREERLGASFNAAINYAIDDAGDHGVLFLSLWREGDWVGIQKEFPGFDLTTAPIN